MILEHNPVENMVIEGLLRADLTGHSHPSQIGRKDLNGPVLLGQFSKGLE